MSTIVNELVSAMSAFNSSEYKEHSIDHIKEAIERVEEVRDLILKLQKQLVRMEDYSTAEKLYALEKML